MRYKILAVDDEAANVRMLERVFRTQFDVVTAMSGAEALELLALHDIALIISDQRMPEMTGVEFLKRAAEMRPRCVRFILTGYTDANDLADALNSNVIYRYITKPWIAEDLLQTVKQGLAHYETLKQHHSLNQENHRLNDRLNALDESSLRIFSQMLGLMSDDAKAELEAGAGAEFDPRITDLFDRLKMEERVPEILVEGSGTNYGFSREDHP
jgi:response regulator RpfG family c-di-GMP phosphodiesterase